MWCLIWTKTDKVQTCQNADMPKCWFAKLLKCQNTDIPNKLSRHVFMPFKVRFANWLKNRQELLGQFSSTVEQKLYHWEWRNNNGKINLKLKSKESNQIRSKVRASKRTQVISYKLYYTSYIIQVILYKFNKTSYIIQVLLKKLYYTSYIIQVLLKKLY
jgi:hypothetical protein